jgi:hypothetical protein
MHSVVAKLPIVTCLTNLANDGSLPLLKDITLLHIRSHFLSAKRFTVLQAKFVYATHNKKY